MTQAGYSVQNESIEVRIKNQPFTPYPNEKGSMVYLLYYIAAKGHFEDWNPNDANWWLKQNLSESYPPGFIGSSDSQYTTETYVLGGYNATIPWYYVYSYSLGNVTDGGQVDFRIQAVIGYSTRYNDTFVPDAPAGDPTDPYSHHYVLTGQISDWSKTETISIPDGKVTISESTSPAATLTPTPTIPELSLLIILPLLLTVFSVSLMLKHRKLNYG